MRSEIVIVPEISGTAVPAAEVHTPGRTVRHTSSVLSVRDLSFAYTRGGEELFDKLTHEFALGKVTAVTAPSGRGKSKLLYVLGLMLTPSRGEVVLDDSSVSRASDTTRSRVRATQIGFVFQASPPAP